MSFELILCYAIVQTSVDIVNKGFHSIEECISLYGPDNGPLIFAFAVLGVGLPICDKIQDELKKM